MFGKSVGRENLSAHTCAKRRINKITRFMLCSSAALAVIAAAGRPTIADAFDWSSAKVSANAYLRIALPSSGLMPPGGQAVPFSQAEFDIFKNTQKQLLLSRMVLCAALKQPGISELDVIKKQKNPLDWLSRNLQVTFPGKAEIMQVSLSGASQKELAEARQCRGQCLHDGSRWCRTGKTRGSDRRIKKNPERKITGSEKHDCRIEENGRKSRHFRYGNSHRQGKKYA